MRLAPPLGEHWWVLSLRKGLLAICAKGVEIWTQGLEGKCRAA